MIFSETERSLGLARRIWRLAPARFGGLLNQPVFVVGFNNSGKSTAVDLIRRFDDVRVYPGEGNSELWFGRHYPWIGSSVSVPPIWFSPETFIQSSKAACGSSFHHARSRLGAYQWLVGGAALVNDSGMLAALAPDILDDFPDAKMIHFVRDGRLASYITARLEWARMIRSPARYVESGCSLCFNDVLRKMAEYWVWTMARMDEVAVSVPGSVLELRYEDWWPDPAPMVKKVGEFIDLPVPERGVYSSKMDLTQHLLGEIRPDELAILDDVAGSMLAAKGYRADS